MKPKRPSHYDILGVSADATAEQIRKAYRRLALRYHPDRNPGDAAAERRFKEIGAAYEVLSDPDKRAAHDREHLGGQPAASPGVSPSGVHRAAGPKHGDIEMNFVISPQCAAYGCIELVAVPEGETCGRCRGVGRDPSRYEACPACSGSRGTLEDRPALCPRCHGRALDPYLAGYYCLHCSGSRWVMVPWWIPCGPCGGHGVARAVCSDCWGDGRAWAWRPVRFPAGISDGRRMRLRGQGPANDSGVHVDIWLVVHIR